MTTSPYRWPALLLALCVCPVTAALAGPPILQAAVDARAQAEAELSRFRAERLDAQARLLRRVDRAQARLSKARAAARDAEERLGAARQAALSAIDAAAGRRARLDALDALLTRSAGAEARVEALEAASRIHSAPATVHDRAGLPHRGPLLMIGPLRFALGPSDATTGLVGGDPPRIGGPRFTPTQIERLRRAERGAGPSGLPLDVSGALAGVEMAPPWTMRRWLAAGGPFVWPILALGLAALLVALDRARATWTDRPPPGLTDAVLAALDRGDAADARAHVAAGRTPLARLLLAGVGDRSAGALEAALAAEDVGLDRGLRLLAVFAGVAPLLGLLGTVSGMIGTFDVIAVHGTGEPRLLSGGIAQALTTTQLGLMVAVPTLLVHAVFGRQAERARAELEAAAARLLDDGGPGRDHG